MSRPLPSYVNVPYARFGLYGNGKFPGLVKGYASGDASCVDVYFPDDNRIYKLTESEVRNYEAGWHKSLPDNVPDNAKVFGESQSDAGTSAAAAASDDGARASARGRGRGRRGRGGRSESSSRTPEVDDTKWCQKNLENNGPPRTNRRGRLSGQRPSVLTVGYFFSLFFTTEVIDYIVEQTNKYYRLKNPRGTWVMKKSLLLKFLAVILIGSMYWNGGSYSHLWQNDMVGGCRHMVAHIMTKADFSMVLNHISFADREAPRPARGEEGWDGFWKTRWLEDTLNKLLQVNYDPGSTLAIDESINPYKGKKLYYRQYMKDKPTKWGEKRQILADSETAVPIYVEHYLGKHGGGLAEHSATMGKAALAVLTPVKKFIESELMETGDVVVMDNWYTSPSLFKDLCNIGVYALGTIRTNRKGYSPEITHTKESASGIERGASLWRMMYGVVEDGVKSCPMLALMYKDNKPVHFLSMLHGDPYSTKQLTRKVWDSGKKAFVQLAVPHVKQMYDITKNAVDRFDQLLANLPLTYVTRKPWHRPMFGMFAIMFTTMFTYARMFKRRYREFRTQRQFRAAMAQWLVEEAERSEFDEWANEQDFDHASGRQQQHVRGETFRQTGVFGDVSAHVPGVSKTRRKCVVCGDDNRKTKDCCTGRRCFGATGGTPVHFGDCWVLWHAGVRGVGPDGRGSSYGEAAGPSQAQWQQAR